MVCLRLNYLHYWKGAVSFLFGALWLQLLLAKIFVLMFEHPAIVLGVAAMPGDALVQTQLFEVSSSLCAHRAKPPLSAGSHWISWIICSYSATVLWMVWEVFLTSRINTACSAYVSAHKYTNHLNLTVFLMEAVYQVHRNPAVSWCLLQEGVASPQDTSIFLYLSKEVWRCWPRPETWILGG